MPSGPRLFSLAISVTAMTVVGLLNRPLDKPNTLTVNSRWIRLAPRILALATICRLPLFENLSGAVARRCDDYTICCVLMGMDSWYGAELETAGAER